MAVFNPLNLTILLARVHGRGVVHTEYFVLILYQVDERFVENSY